MHRAAAAPHLQGFSRHLDRVSRLLFRLGSELGAI
ncbi:MAG: hypothetical protein ACI82F_004141 [Planctomycetota bacterium]